MCRLPTDVEDIQESVDRILSPWDRVIGALTGTDKSVDYHDVISSSHECMMEACRKKHANATDRSFESGFCGAVWDSVSCWPTTTSGDLAVVACPAKYRDFSIDTNFNATRLCTANGTWAERSNYDSCVNESSPLFDQQILHNQLMHQATDLLQGETNAHLGVLGVYYVGYAISLLSSCVALWLFFYFRTLHCLRNTLHCNLIITYILVDCTWIIMTSVSVMNPSDVLQHDREKTFEEAPGQIDCRVFVAIFNYFQVTNFFWMLVEGLYIIWIIFRAHKLETLVFWPFAVIGWGLPIVVVVIWVPIKMIFDNAQCWWTDITSAFNFVYIGPILFVLMVNVIFLLIIMHVLLRKYRGMVTTGESTRRTAKSFFILLPLLGITYLMVLVLPPQPGLLRTGLKYVIAFTNSMQGFFVSLLYCFFNAEVRSTVRLRGNSFFPYRTWLKLDPSSTRRSMRSMLTAADLASGDPAVLQMRPRPLSRYRQIIVNAENRRDNQLNAKALQTANRNEIAYLLKEREHQDRLQKQIKHQALGYRSTVF